MDRRNAQIGVLLIAVAIVLLLGKIGVFSFVMSILWPLAVLIPGLLLHFLFFGRMLPSGVLIPGGILITYALMFFYCEIFGWDSMSYLWPGFILGVAVGLYEVHLFDRHAPRGVISAAIVLALIAAVFFGLSIIFTVGVYVIAAALILVGVVMMMRRPRTW